ncbi:ComEC/Rec2 family competence protein [Rheinheimera fenheensis]|uniref:ComEC/Rec2 family competence protein n=1 Tax=Rheinheimera fenheensis TaxID=3152295 RepID=UPI00325C7845
MKTYALISIFVLALSLQVSGAEQQLEIHYINVGQGASTLIIGPNGTRILYDFGNKDGKESIVPYLESLGWQDSKHLDYTILSHRDRDHYYGYKGLIDSGFNVLVANFGPAISDRGSKTLGNSWINPAKATSAGAVQEIKPGMRVSLGNGAEMLVAASNGQLLNGKTINVKNENDRSISLLIKYGEFDFILDGDLGGGSEECSLHSTSQVDVQTEVARALLSLGEIDSTKGVEILHVAHHGSESSSPARYLRIMKPEIGIIAVGNPNCSYQHPRKNVINTLNARHQPSALNSASDCSALTPLKHVFQTDRGSDDCDAEPTKILTDNTSIVSGDIVITTEGKGEYSIRTTGMTWMGRKRVKTEEQQVYKFSTD